MIINIDLPNEAASERLAAQLANCLSAGTILTFSGEPGAGKTTFIRALLRALGVNGPVKSPTFSLVESYLCQGLQVHHFDLYRIHHEDDLEYIGFRDYFVPEAVCCIEWPERAENNLADVDLRFALSMKGSGRIISIEALRAAGEEMLMCLAGNHNE